MVTGVPIGTWLKRRSASGAGQANTAVGGRMSRPRNGAGVQSHAIPREAKKIGHLGPGEAATRRYLMAAPLGVGDDNLAVGIVYFAVEV
jgi:hypothetical protein